MPERDRLQLSTAAMTDQTRHEPIHGTLLARRATMLAPPINRVVDHPCINHRSPRMTLVYARIANTVVADQYFNASRAVEADTLAVEPLSEEGDTCRPHRRLLGNGHCTRPLELDCRFQTICEGCGFYQTGPDFVTILRS